MKKLIACLTIIALFIGLIGLPAYAQQSSSFYSSEPVSAYSTLDPNFEYDPPGELILADVLILRPFGIAASAVGLVGSLVALPFAATSCSGDRVVRKLIQEPFDYTWCRPVGDVDY